MSVPRSRASCTMRLMGAESGDTIATSRPAEIIMDNDHLVLSALQPDTVASRLESREAPEAEEDEE